jgi:hypothetical protein
MKREGKAREEGGKNEGRESGKSPVRDRFPLCLSLFLSLCLPSLFP